MDTVKLIAVVFVIFCSLWVAIEISYGLPTIRATEEAALNPPMQQ